MCFTRNPPSAEAVGFVEVSGDLDECNGRIGITPEFPGVIYHYYATDSYPYFQRCVKGAVEVAEACGGNGPRGGRPDFKAAAERLGVSERDLMQAIGGPPPNFKNAAEVLGISVEDIRKALRR